MDKIKDIVENIKAISKTDRAPIQSFVGPIQQLLTSIDSLDKDTSDFVLKELKDSIADLKPMKSAFLSIACGALVENGANPMIWAHELLKKVNNLLLLAMDFNNACFHAGVPNSDDPQSLIATVKAKKPLEAEAWDAIDRIYPAVVSTLSKSKEARRIVKSYNELIDLTYNLARNNEGGQWLAKIVSVLDDEEILVFYPSLELGYKVRISGISDNYQLHILLADALIGNEKEGWIPGKKPDPQIISHLKDVHYTGDAHFSGVFEMRNYKALKPDGKLVQYFEEYKNTRFDFFFIWGEGPPISIPKFENYRIVLLSPPAEGKVNIQRSFNARREFQFLNAELEVLEMISKEQVRSWLNRMKNSN